jgi:hypothetical protein
LLTKKILDKDVILIDKVAKKDERGEGKEKL